MSSPPSPLSKEEKRNDVIRRLRKAAKYAEEYTARFLGTPIILTLFAAAVLFGVAELISGFTLTLVSCSFLMIADWTVKNKKKKLDHELDELRHLKDRGEDDGAMKKVCHSKCLVRCSSVEEYLASDHVVVLGLVVVAEAFSCCCVYFSLVVGKSPDVVPGHVAEAIGHRVAAIVSAVKLSPVIGAILVGLPVFLAYQIITRKSHLAEKLNDMADALEKNLGEDESEAVLEEVLAAL